METKKNYIVFNLVDRKVEHESKNYNDAFDYMQAHGESCYLLITIDIDTDNHICKGINATQY